MNLEFHKHTEIIDLKNTLTGEIFGKSINEYTILRCSDFSNLKNVKGYVVTLKQRIIIPNPKEYQPGSSSVIKYEKYPILFENEVDLVTDSKAKIKLHSLFPKTLNTTVNLNSSSQTGKDTSNTVQHTSGSSTTNVNTFSVDVGGGYMMGTGFFQISFGYKHDWIAESNKSQSQSSGTTLQNQNSHTNAMSVKDWSSYSTQSKEQDKIKWIWSQSYPWNAIFFNAVAGGGDTINLPEFVKSRMFNNGILLPPSELSLFGLDFTQTAAWIITFPEGENISETISLKHKINSFSATHQLNGNDLSASMDSANESSVAEFQIGALDLSLYSLSPIFKRDIASIGFLKSEFIAVPAKYSDTFKIMSNITNLMITGTGFDKNMTSDFSSPTSMDLTFKIPNHEKSYALELIHSVGNESGDCKVEWLINDKHQGSLTLCNDTSTEKQNARTTISLRNVDYESLNFHDYLTIGVNNIKLTFTPIDKTKKNSYNISVITIY